MIDSTKQNSARPYILGVAGGSGSGKTYFAKALQQSLGTNRCEIIFQDNFYIDQSKQFDFDGGAVNFDHPSSIDFKLLCEKLKVLREGQAVQLPIYDFVTHQRSTETISVEPKPVIIVDGILIFHDAPLRSQFDDLLFFDTPEDLRFQRRLNRDVHERGRSEEGVHNQFYKQVKPMHDQFVEPSKAFAKKIVSEVVEFDATLSEYCQRLKKN